MRKGDLIEMIYITNKDRALSQRVIRVINVSDHYVLAYCYTRRHLRIFKKENILASQKITSASYA